ncbi:MAG: hypothetical protein ACLFQ5_08815 [Oceanicaulis sp.]
MKHWLTAAALAPVLTACASAGAAETADAGARVLIVNGERIAIRPGADAAAAIEAALDRRGDRRLHVQMTFEEADAWDEGAREVFAEAVAALGSGPIEDAMFVAFGAEDFSFAFEGDIDTAGLERRAERAERGADRHAERLERHAARMARRAERLAAHAEREGRRAEAFGRRMELYGLEAGVKGMESGLAGIDDGLARGWTYDGGERRALSENDRRELEEAREELERELQGMRARLAEARDRHGERRRVQIRRDNGEVRAWVNGEEVTGADLDQLLEDEESRLAGAPVPPPPPAPRAEAL